MSRQGGRAERLRTSLIVAITGNHGAFSFGAGIGGRGSLRWVASQSRSSCSVRLVCSFRADVSMPVSVRFPVPDRLDA